MRLTGPQQRLLSRTCTEEVKVKGGAIRTARVLLALGLVQQAPDGLTATEAGRAVKDGRVRVTAAGTPLPAVVAPPVASGPFVARQSTVSGFAVCGRRTYHDLTREGDYTVGYSEATADLGTVFHAVAAEIFRTLWQQGEKWMPTEEAMTVCWEVYAGLDIVLPPEEREALRILVLRFVERPWSMENMIAVEERITMPITCHDGVVRHFTGQPDLLVADPPSTLIIVDLKSGWGRPREPRQKPSEGEVVQGKQYLSDRGHAQLDGYGLLAMWKYPRAARVILREYHVRTGQVREAHLTREELEHVEKEIGDLLMKLDRGLSEGEGSKLWKPRPSAACTRQCPVARTCPVPAEQRGVGAIPDLETALAEGERYVAVDGVRQQLRDGLANWHDQTGQPIPVGNGMELRRAQEHEHKSRTFDLWPVEHPQEPDDLAGAFEAAAARKAAACTKT